MREYIRETLKEHSEQKYREFSSSLIPDSKPLLGVRLPELRKLAKELVKKEDWRQEVICYDGEYEDVYFEEVMLRGMMIGYGTKSDVPSNLQVDADNNASGTYNMEERWEKGYGLSLISDFIPCIDNWSVCDSFCNSFLLADKQRAEVFLFLQKYIYSDKEFEVRVALITLLVWYIKYDINGKKIPRKRIITMQDVQNDTSKETFSKFPYIDKVFGILNRKYTQGYYAQMAAAWTMAEVFTCFPYETNRILVNDCCMDEWTYNKTLQKICESRIPDAEVKDYIKSLKKK